MKTTGINIQYPISELVLTGVKSVETRTYALPQNLTGKNLALIETPGKHGKFKARIRGLICFSECFLYESESHFYSEFKRHHVAPDSDWRWDAKPKWGWQIARVAVFRNPIQAPTKKGIVYTSEVELPDDALYSANLLSDFMHI